MSRLKSNKSLISPPLRKILFYISDEALLAVCQHAYKGAIHLEGCQGADVVQYPKRLQADLLQNSCRYVHPELQLLSLQTKSATSKMTDITWPPELYITFLFDQVFQRLPLHIKRNICNKSSVSFSRISIWLKAISSSFDTFLFSFFILAWSFTFTASKER